MSYVFWRVPLSIKLRPEKRYSCLAVSWNVWGSLDCFGRFLEQITTKKKRYSCLAIGCNVGLVLAGSSLCFLAGSLIKLQITIGKKGTVVWPLVGMSHLKHASPWWSRSLAQAAWPWVISQCSQGPLFARGCPRAGCEVFCELYDLAEIFFL
jgi:hypothetical protein